MDHRPGAGDRSRPPVRGLGGPAGTGRPGRAGEPGHPFRRGIAAVARGAGGPDGGPVHRQRRAPGRDLPGPGLPALGRSGRRRWDRTRHRSGMAQRRSLEAPSRGGIERLGGRPRNGPGCHRGRRHLRAWRSPGLGWAGAGRGCRGRRLGPPGADPPGATSRDDARGPGTTAAVNSDDLRRRRRPDHDLGAARAHQASRLSSSALPSPDPSETAHCWPQPTAATVPALPAPSASTAVSAPVASAALPAAAMPPFGLARITLGWSSEGASPLSSTVVAGLGRLGGWSWHWRLRST